MTARKSWVYVDGKPYEKGTEPEPTSAPMVMGDIEPFISPITREVIRGRGHLRRHMKEHGVTNAADYSGEWLAKRRESIVRDQERRGRIERTETIRELMRKR